MSLRTRSMIAALTMTGGLLVAAAPASAAAGPCEPAEYGFTKSGTTLRATGSRFCTGKPTQAMPVKIEEYYSYILEQIIYTGWMQRASGVGSVSWTCRPGNKYRDGRSGTITC
ncbi:hypothetical protein OG474_09450 [Kribbella sp. NBC_01505]|uniref:hypothetical protein n=1 Tax=Kribbella sp. NBC_01505 TaxID=2903580 RepID=UPI0038677742